MHALLVFVAGVIAGGINALAGGGSLVSFPTLIWLGAPPILADATNATALWPGTLASAWGYRRELRGVDRRVYALIVPSVIGSMLGAVLLHRTAPGVFDRLVPLLILFATCLFMAQDRLQRRFNLTAAHAARSHWLSWTMGFQLVVAVYGGYFGGGMGILMLATLTLMGHTDIHRMNGLKSVLSASINGVAATYFIVNGMVIWSDALMMAVGAVIGGIGGATIARYIGHLAVRRVVIVVGFAMTVMLMLRL
ncbi:MAG: sulfite exporter TauE/SafE family protein [Acidobacteria bacterium]|nr:sulfite exporter TauE/SafE family protein [Acidobacteriota bacterium]